MSVAADHHGVEAGRRGSRGARALVVGAAVCLVGAGLLLWWRYGGAIFNDIVLSALAWCF